MKEVYRITIFVIIVKIVDSILIITILLALVIELCNIKDLYKFIGLPYFFRMKEDKVI